MHVKRKRIRRDPLTNIKITDTRGGVQLTKDLLLLGLHHLGGVLQLGEEGWQVADTPRRARVTPETRERSKGYESYGKGVSGAADCWQRSPLSTLLGCQTRHS